MNPIYGTIGWVAGGRWNNSDVTPAGQRLSFARGALQLFSSTLTATGFASFIGFVTAQGGDLTWSWPLWVLCVGIVLLFDAAFNIVLNLLSGIPYVVMLIARIGLTLVMAQFTAQTLTMMWSERGLAPIAEKLASIEFDRSLKSLSDERTDAEKSANTARTALTSFESGINSATLTATIPAGCAIAAITNFSDDPTLRGAQQRAERQRQSRCNQLINQALESERKRQQGGDSLRASLQDAVKKAEARLNLAQTAYAEKDAGRKAAVEALAQNMGIKAAALDELKSTNDGTKKLFLAVLVIVLFVELLSVFVKFVTSRIDESSNRESAEIAAAANDYAQNRYVSSLMQDAYRHVDRSSLVETAKSEFSAQAEATLAVHHASNMSGSRRQRLRGELGVGD